MDPLGGIEPSRPAGHHKTFEEALWDECIAYMEREIAINRIPPPKRFFQWFFNVLVYEVAVRRLLAYLSLG